MRLFLSGASSTGKSTLVRALLPKLTKIYGEFTVVESTRKVPTAERLTHAGQLKAYAQYMSDVYDAGWKTLNVISPRTIFDYIAYSKVYESWDYSLQKLKIKEALGHQFLKPDLCLYLPIEFDQVDDDERPPNTPLRVVVDEAIRTYLAAYWPEVTLEVRGTVEDRVNMVMEEIKKRKI